ncbi:ABC transporter substrate-binding protein [Treponema sp. R80B11-R83G3]
MSIIINGRRPSINPKKIVFFASVVMLAMLLPAARCNLRGEGSDDTGQTSNSDVISLGQPKIPKAPASVVKTIKAMGGVIIGNWWENYDVNSVVPKSDYDEKLLEYRKALLKNNGIVIVQKNIGGWNQMLQNASTSIMSGKPAAHVMVLQPDWALSLYRQNLLYPVSDNGQVDLGKTNIVDWNKTVNDVFTFNNKIYAFTPGYGGSFHATIIVWNKRLFREAGLDPNLPYDLQKNNQWTWDEFLEICKKLTRDINNDGKIDIYAMPSDLSTEILDAFVGSNGAAYVDKDPKTEKLVNATTRPEFVEAVQFFMKLRDEKVMMEKPPNARWDWHIPAFNDGKVAMRIDQQYIVNNFSTLKDDWGMILPPIGPKAKNYTVFTDENVMIVPATYKKAQVDAIMWAVQAWYTPIDNDWKAPLYQVYRDRRAIDETWAYIRDPKFQRWRYHLHVPGLNRGDIAWKIWYHDGEAAQLIEAVSQQWNALIEDANK